MIIDLDQGPIGECPDCAALNKMLTDKLGASGVSAGLLSSKKPITPELLAHAKELLSSFEPTPDVTPESTSGGGQLLEILINGTLHGHWPSVRLRAHPLVPHMIMPLDLPSTVAMVLLQEDPDLETLKDRLPPLADVEAGHWMHGGIAYLWSAEHQRVVTLRKD